MCILVKTGVIKVEDRIDKATVHRVTLIIKNINTI